MTSDRPYRSSDQGLGLGLDIGRRPDARATTGNIRKYYGSAPSARPQRAYRKEHCVVDTGSDIEPTRLAVFYSTGVQTRDWGLG